MAGTFNSGGLNAPPTSIVNVCSAGDVQIDFTSAVLDRVGKQTLSGILSANTYKVVPVLDITGAGVLNVAAVYTVDTTSHTVGLIIIIDGKTIFDAVSSTITAAWKGLIGAGIMGIGTSILPTPMVFTSSLIVNLKSSNAETDKIGLCHDYHLT